MKSPLNIGDTVSRYSLDAKLKNKLIAFDKYIWQDCRIKSVADLTAFEKKYNELGKNFDFCYDVEVNGFTPVFMCNGQMTLLSTGAFQRISKSNGELHAKLVEAGLSEIDSVYVRSFLADISGLYRKDSYHFGVPPFIQSVCKGLNDALAKLPIYSNTVVRACHEYDKVDLKVGDIFNPGFCLTCSADVNWKEVSKNRYKIQPMDADHSRARSLFHFYDVSEKQVTFLQDAHFKVIEINDWGEGKKEFVMEEIE